MCDCECFAVYCSSSALHYLPVIRWCCEIYVPVNMWFWCCVLLLCCWCVDVLLVCRCFYTVCCCVLLVCSVEAHWSRCGSGEEEEVTGQQRHTLEPTWPGQQQQQQEHCTVVTVTVVCSPLNKHSAVTVLVSLNISKYHSHSLQFPHVCWKRPLEKFWLR